MSKQSASVPVAAPAKSFLKRFLSATEIDTRMLGMVAALFAIWCAFDIYSGFLRPNTGLFGGAFLTPRNLWTLLVQTSSIAVMTTGMVLIIVMRHIDLSVGSMLSLVAVAGAVLQVFILGPATRCRPSGHLDCRDRSLSCPRHSAWRAEWLLDRLCPDSGLHRHARRPHRL